VDCLEDLLARPSASRGAPGTRADRARVPGLSAADVLVFGAGAGARVVVRASGTEPKLKLYLQSVVPVEGGLGDAQLRAEQRLGELERDLRSALEGQRVRSTRCAADRFTRSRSR
jgi:phosphomannomutase